MTEEYFFEHIFPIIMLIPLLTSALWAFRLVYQFVGMVKKTDIQRKGVALALWLLLIFFLAIPIAVLALVGHSYYPFSFKSEFLDWTQGLFSWFATPVIIFFVIFFALQRTRLFKRFPAGFWSKLAWMGIAFAWTLVFFVLWVVANTH